MMLVLAGMLPAAASAAQPFLDSNTYIDTRLDLDRNGVEDVLDAWLAGTRSWQDLRDVASPPDSPLAAADYGGAHLPVQKVWQAGRLRLIGLGVDAQDSAEAEALAAAAGSCDLLHDLDFLGGVRVLALDEAGLAAYLTHKPDGRILLDRDGTPALDGSTVQMGARQLRAGAWNLGEDWSATVAILDSGCDTAHDDLGDHNSDDVDGPPPFVGDANDWYPGDAGWPVFAGYRVVGWQDVTDDFPQAVGPWDYHYHGTALASVVAGSGRVEADHAGVAPGARLTVVKYYDFDGIWHTWAGDFLAACAWTLEQRDTYRIRVVLSAVNWDEDLGITDAMNALVGAGLLPVVAMGNHGEEGAPGYPAVVGDVLTVGAVNDAGALSAYSGRGVAGHGKPDMLAPGGGLLPDAGWIEVADNEPNDTYSPRQGTSLAAAHTAGAAFLLSEALRDNGVRLPADATSARTLRALLKATSARVAMAETPSGEDLIGLGVHDEPDEARGWGRLRADAAVAAVLDPLFPGVEETDTLSADETRITVARRAILQPEVRYLVEAIPSAGLDVDLAVVDPRHLDFSAEGLRVLRRNAAGAGVSEFLYIEPENGRWSSLVVRRVSGSGTVVLRVVEADVFAQQGRTAELPGRVTGAPSYGDLPLAQGTALVVPSLVDLDPQARSVNVYDGWGLPLPGWPVYVFPVSSSLGGLTQPIVWDMDGVDGDEIVISSEYGSIYFFNALGAYQSIGLDFNVPLTPVVGWEPDGLPRLAVVVDDNGELRAYSWGPQLEIMRDLGHAHPLAPAVGRLAADENERLVVAFADGMVFALDEQGQDLPGWPVDLGMELGSPPILVDLDGDRNREIVLPVFDPMTGELEVRLLGADGQAIAGDGTALPPPEGNAWLAVSEPVVAGRAVSGDLRLEVIGLVDNGLRGAQARQHLGRAGWWATGSAFSTRMPHLSIEATTSQGFLENQRTLLAPPLAWDFRDGPGSETALLGAFRWREVIYGQTAIEASTVAWFLDRPQDRLLTARPPATPGGSEETTPSSVASALVPVVDDVYRLVQIHDRRVQMSPLRPQRQLGHFWPLARRDRRNSGSFPVDEDLSTTPVRVAGRLDVHPNPGPGRFYFRWNGDLGAAPTTLTIYDLRGRQVAQMHAGGEGRWVWDGRDRQGRQSAAGAYLAVARGPGVQSTVRLLLTR